MGLVDRMIEAISPRWALRRELAKVHKQRLYDIGKVSGQRTRPTDNRSGNGVMDHARESVRNLARHLDENHDLAIGLLDSLVNNIVGPKGINIEPQVKTKGGKLNDKANKEIRKAMKKWMRRPDTSQSIPFGELQRIVCRSWLRDGEILIQHVQGRSGYQYPTRIPYALELIEADYLPFDLNQDNRNGPKIVHGVEMNTWRQPLQYHVYLEHPNDRLFYNSMVNKTKAIPAKAVTHLKFTRRVNQVRGISLLHGVIARLDDLKDYEESERIAARVAAAMTGYIKKAPEMTGNLNTSAEDRSLEMQAGMIWDNLLPGEEIGTIESNRPNTGLEAFRDGQLRAVAAGAGASYSAIAKNYNGTYSSQRQELVESQPHYERLRNVFVSVFIDDVYRNFIDMALISGDLQLPRNIDQDSLYEYEARGQGMTWIDPKKEIEADALAIQHRLKSRRQTIRDRGGDPAIVDEQLELELEYDQLHGFGSPSPETSANDPAKEQAGSADTPNQDEDEEQDEEQEAANA